MTGLFIRIKNYEQFQHYKKRNAPWIKLYFELLSDKDFMALDEADRFILIAIWLLATRYHGASNMLAGCMPFDPEQLAFSLRRDTPPDIRPLVEKNFLSLVDEHGNDASNMLDGCYQDASNMLDRDRDRDRGEKRTSTSSRRPRHTFEPEDHDAADWMLRKIRTVYANFREPSLAAWANDIRLMRQRDGRSIEEIKDLFSRANADPFWCTNILSPAKLRKQWDQLTIKLKQKPAKGSGRPTLADYENNTTGKTYEHTTDGEQT